MNVCACVNIQLVLLATDARLVCVHVGDLYACTSVNSRVVVVVVVVVVCVCVCVCLCVCAFVNMNIYTVS